MSYLTIEREIEAWQERLYTMEDTLLHLEEDEIEDEQTDHRNIRKNKRSMRVCDV